MAEVLSQSEIDALLSALSSGDVGPELEEKEEKHKYKKYDFKSPQKFSKDHIRTLEKIHDNYARILSSYLGGQLRRNVRINVESVEQVTYEEFIRSIPNPTIISYFTLAPLQGTILMEINPQFAYQILEILLGGTGDRKSVKKEFTDIEKNIVSQICKGAIQNIKLAWDEILKVEPKFEAMETNPSANQTLGPNEPVALINFAVELGRTTTYLNLCIPYLSVEKLLDKLIVQYWFQNSQDDDKEKMVNKIKDTLKPVEVDLRFELGNTEITIDQFLKLVPGDILRLDTKIDKPVTVYVGDEPCYIAKPGIVGKKMGGELLDIIDKDVKEDE